MTQTERSWGVRVREQASYFTGWNLLGLRVRKQIGRTWGSCRRG